MTSPARSLLRPCGPVCLVGSSARQSLCRGLTAAVLAALAGCGSGEAHKIAAVSGKVTLDGNPLAGATIVFQPEATEKSGAAGPGSAAVTGADGSFTLQVAEAKKRPGAVVGKHVVRITGVQSQRDVGDDTAGPRSKDPVPPLYRDQGVPFEVPAVGTDKANFELQSRGPQQTPGLPAGRNTPS